ncbi:hypothetical protein I4F81_009680 [Pyropia yezoensis]|uniref:Uncharacterized protein n=1 Tax=Pyropia yezoensis TaxID=2788 RepID=A0ACC3CBL9_PYRYE|nr:hypothetical protein I4F81_009680 [Neopyropia yezoensis]
MDGVVPADFPGGARGATAAGADPPPPGDTAPPAATAGTVPAPPVASDDAMEGVQPAVPAPTATPLGTAVPVVAEGGAGGPCRAAPAPPPPRPTPIPPRLAAATAAAARTPLPPDTTRTALVTPTATDPTRPARKRRRTEAGSVAVLPPPAHRRGRARPLRPALRGGSRSPSAPAMPLAAVGRPVGADSEMSAPAPPTVATAPWPTAAPTLPAAAPAATTAADGDAALSAASPPVAAVAAAAAAPPAGADAATPCAPLAAPAAPGAAATPTAAADPPVAPPPTAPSSTDGWRGLRLRRRVRLAVRPPPPTPATGVTMSDTRRGAAAGRDEATAASRSAAASGPTSRSPQGGGPDPGGPPAVRGASSAPPAAGVGGAVGGAVGGGAAATAVPCPVPGCGVLLSGGVGAPAGLQHLRQAHVAPEVPPEVLAALGAAGCRWCERPFPASRGRRGNSSLSCHETLCRLNPRRQRARPPLATAARTVRALGAPRAAARATTTAAAGGAEAQPATAATAATAAASATADTAAATATAVTAAATATAATAAATATAATATAAAATAAATATADALRAEAAPATAPPATLAAVGGGRPDATLFAADHAAWARARGAFLRASAPTDAAWPSLVASGARTSVHVPAALLGAWRRLFADALDWVWREPTQRHAWLWLLLLPSLALHSPTPAVPQRADADPTAALSHAARATALLDGDFAGALGDRNAGIWRPPVGRGARPAGAVREGDALSPARPARPTAAQRRALRQVRSGRLSAAARSLLAAPAAAKTPAVWAKACRLFPPAAPELTAAASVAAAFPAELVAAEAAATDAPAPATLSRAAVETAIRSAAAGKAPGPSGLRTEHLWALAPDGQDVLVEVLLLLAGDHAAVRVPAVAARALAGADLVLLTKSGGLQADGLPGLRPIGMPETLRKLVASALARAVRGAAAALFAPLQQGVGVSSACERMLHELEAHLALHPRHALLQLDYKNAFNLVSRRGAWAVLSRAFPLLRPYLTWVYGGEEGKAAPPVYGWAPGGAADDPCGARSGGAAPGGGGGHGDGDGGPAGPGGGVCGAGGGAALAVAAACGAGGGGGGDGCACGGGRGECAGPARCERDGDDAAARAAGGDGGGGGTAGEESDAGRRVPAPPRRLVLRAERGAQQGDPLGPLLHAAALWLVLRRLEAEHPRLLVRAFHDDVVVVGPPAALPPALADADRLGRCIDAQLAPAKCVGWSPAGLPAPEGWPATWAPAGVTQFSVPLGSDAHVAAGVDALAEEQGRLSAAIAALPPAELQAQLLLLRLCSGPRPNYWLRALPLQWGARLAAAVDRDARAAVLSVLCDARDGTATRDAVGDRAALPPAMGGLGIGGRARVLPAAALASWVDALRAGAAYSPALAAIRDRLEAVPVAAADGGVVPPPPRPHPRPPPPVPPSRPRPRPPPPGPSRPTPRRAGPAAGGVQKRRPAARPTRGRGGGLFGGRHLFDPPARPPPRQPPTPASPPRAATPPASSTPSPSVAAGPRPAAAGVAAPTAAYAPVAPTAAAAPCPRTGWVTGGPDGEDVEFHFVTPSPPPPLSTPPPLVGGAPRPCTAEAASLCAGLLELLAAQQAHCTAPDRGLLWVRRRPAAPARPRGRPDPLAPPPSSFPPPARAPPPLPPRAAPGPSLVPWPTAYPARRRTRHCRGGVFWGGRRCRPASGTSPSRRTPPPARASTPSYRSGSARAWRRARGTAPPPGCPRCPPPGLAALPSRGWRCARRCGCGWAWRRGRCRRPPAAAAARRLTPPGATFWRPARSSAPATHGCTTMWCTWWLRRCAGQRGGGRWRWRWGSTPPLPPSALTSAPPGRGRGR